MAVEVARLVAEVVAETTQFEAGMAKAEGRMATASATMSRSGAAMTKFVTLPVIAAGGAAVHMATQFNESMTKVEALVGVSHKQVQDWSAQLLKLGPEVGKSPKELADALFFVTSAGFRGKAAIDVLTASAKASASGMGDTKTVADAVTSAVNAYGIKALSASKATDVLTAAVTAGKMPPEDLARSLGRVLPLASQMGVSFDQVGASIAAMSRQGISARLSGMGLASMLSNLLKPSTKVEGALASVGESADSLKKEIRDKGLLTTMLDLKDKFHGNTDAMAQAMGTSASLRTFMILTGKSAHQNVGIFKDLADSTGATSRAFKVTSEDSGFKFKKLLAELQSAAIQLGDVLLPVVTKVVHWFTELLDNYNHLSPRVHDLIGKFVLVAAAIGPILAIGGKLLGMFRLISAAFAANPFTLAVAGAVALGIALVELWKHSKTFRDGVTQLWNGIKSVVIPIADTLRDIFQKIVGELKAHKEDLAGIAASIGHVFSVLGDVFQKIMPIVKPVVEFIINVLIKDIIAQIKIWAAVISTAVDVVVGVFTTLIDAGKAVWNFFKDLPGNIADLFKKGVGEIGGAAKDIGEGILNNVLKPIKNIAEDVWAFIAGIGDKIAHMASTIAKWGADIATKIFNAVIGGLKDIGSKTWDAIKDIGKWVADKLTDVFNWGASIANKIKNAVVDTLKGIGEGAWNIINNIGQFIADKATLIFNWGASIATKIKNAVVDTLVGIGSAAWEIINNIGSFIADKASAIFNWGVGIANKIKNAVTDTLVGIGSAAWDVINNIGQFIADKAKMIAGWGDDIGNWIEKGFREAMHVGAWIADKIHDGWDAVISALKWLKNKIVGALSDLFDIHSPSRVFAWFGEQMMAGLAQGIRDKFEHPVEALKWIFKMMGVEMPSWLEIPLEWGNPGDWPEKTLQFLTEHIGALQGVLSSVFAGAAQPGAVGLPPGIWPREGRVIVKANEIANQRWPYAVGGGQNPQFAPSRGAPHWGMSGSRVGYDCSGSVSAIFHAGDYLSSPQVSGYFYDWGHAGYGKYVTTFAKPGEGSDGHVFAVLNGAGWGTGGNNDGGPGWYEHDRGYPYRARHPIGSQSAVSSVPTDAGNRSPQSSGGGQGGGGDRPPSLSNFVGVTNFNGSEVVGLPDGGLLFGVAGPERDQLLSQLGFHAYARGGIALSPHMGLVGEAGPEAMIPLDDPKARDMLGGRATPINIFVAGNVLTERDLVDAVHQGLQEKFRSTGDLRLA